MISRFGELEACFQLSSAQPVPVRLTRVQTLTDATAVLVGALKCEHAQTYARFISSCMAMDGGAC